MKKPLPISPSQNEPNRPLCACHFESRMYHLRPILLLWLLWQIAGNLCAQKPVLGYIEKLHPGLDNLLATGTSIEVLDSSFHWAEGPLWLPGQQVLLFTDIPANRVYQWSEAKGTELYLEPSGYTGKKPRGGEPGANGLVLLQGGKLLLCQHGDRRLAIMNAPLRQPRPLYQTVVSRYKGKRFNSPNDAVQTPDGAILFTDPPYGLEGGMGDPAKELPFQGLYQYQQGSLRLLTDTLSRPNGLVLLPDGATLLVANSDETKAGWYRFRYHPANGLTGGALLRDVTREAQAWGGFPDGLKCTRAGYVFATGPGGVWIFDPELSPIGRIRLPVKAANVALNEQDRVLYITATQYLLRVKLR